MSKVQHVKINSEKGMAISAKGADINLQVAPNGTRGIDNVFRVYSLGPKLVLKSNNT